MNKKNDSVTIDTGLASAPILVSILIGMLFANFLWMYARERSEEQIVEARDSEWRNAAAPVFNARGVPGITQTATPYVLAMMLDARTITHKRGETYIESAPSDEEYLSGTKITIEPVRKVDWQR